MRLHRDRFLYGFILLGLLLPVAWSTGFPAADVETRPSPGAATPQPPGAEARAWKPAELDSLVAPIALYPDPLLAQMLAASTYPLELVEAHQWLEQHSDLKEKALTEAAAQEDWDPSVQALVVFPGVLDRMTENIRWTTDLGNAFLAQQQDVMDAVQRMRLEARNSGRLKSTREQEVTTKEVEERTVVEIVPADPAVIYVPVYSPAAIWGAPVYYNYPPLWYPAWPSAADYWIDFGVGISMGLFFGGWNDWYYDGWRGCSDWRWGWGWGWHGWGWGCGWGGNSAIIYNNYFCDHYGYHHDHRGDHDGHGGRGGHDGHDNHGHSDYGSWQHDPDHRGGVAYRGQDVARRYGTDAGRRLYPRTGAQGSDGPDGLYRGTQNRTSGRYTDASRASGAGGSRGNVARDSRGDGRSASRSRDITAAFDRLNDRRTSADGYPNSDTGRTGSAGRSTYSRSESAGGRRTGSGSLTIGGSSGSDRQSRSGESVTIGRSTNRSLSASGNRSTYSNRPSYGSSSSYGNRSIPSGRSYSGGSTSGSRAYSGGSSSGNRSYSFGRSSGSRSFSGGGSYGGRSYSGSGSSGGHSFSGGGSSRSGGSSGRSSGGRSFSGGGGSRGGSSGGSHRR